MVKAVVTLSGGQLQGVQILSADDADQPAEAPDCTALEEFEDPAQCATEEPNPILPETREIFWGGLSFLVLFLLMRLWLYPRVKQVMEARAAKIDGDLLAAEQARTSVTSEQQAYADRIAAARTEASAIIESARAEVEAVRSQRIGALNAELAQVRAQAQSELDASVAQAQANFTDTVADVAVTAASKVLGQPVDRAAALPTVTDYMQSAEVNR